MIAARAARSRRVGWGLADQALSSASNFLVGLVVVRTVPLEDFGAFSIAYVVYLFCLGAFRGLGGKTFAIRFTQVDPSRRADERAALAGLALVVGSAAGAICVVAGLAFTTGSLRGLLVALGLVLGVLLMQDAWRFSFVTAGQPAKAACNDAVWLVAQLVLFVVVLSAGDPGVVGLFVVWAGAGAIAALVGAAQAGRWPRPLAGVRFARAHRTVGGPLAAEQVVSQGANQLGILALGGLLPLASIGTLRAGQLMLSPLNVLQQAAPLSGLPEAVRARATPRALTRVVASIAGALALAAIALGVLLVIIPDSWGRAVFGDGWQAGLEVLPALVVRNVAGAVTIGAFIGLQALERTGLTFRIGLTRGVVSLSATVLAGWLLGLQGAVWAMAMADGVTAVLAVVAYRSTTSTPGSTSHAGVAAPAHEVVPT